MLLPAPPLPTVCICFRQRHLGRRRYFCILLNMEFLTQASSRRKSPTPGINGSASFDKCSTRKRPKLAGGAGLLPRSCVLFIRNCGGTTAHSEPFRFQNSGCTKHSATECCSRSGLLERRFLPATGTCPLTRLTASYSFFGARSFALHPIEQESRRIGQILR